MTICAYRPTTPPSLAPVPGAPVMRDTEMAIPKTWRAKSGATLQEAVGLRWVGNPMGPLVAVLGGISANGHVASNDEGWWPGLVGPGRVIDTDRYFVVSMDYPPYQANRPISLCPEDFARLFKAALDDMGAARIDCFVGASFGGMVGLAFARLFPETVEQLSVLCAAHRPTPMATAVRSVQRQILDLTAGTNREADGICLARQLAMTTYRSLEEFEQRFSNDPGSDPVSYLTHQGRAYARKVSAPRFATLSAAIDRHNEDPAAITVPTQVIASDTDRLAPLSVTQELAAWLPRCSGHHVIPSIYGHDAFLKEDRKIAPLLRRVLP